MGDDNSNLKVTNFMKELNNILLVDDSKVARMMTSSVIKGMYPNIKINEAGSGEEALKFLESDTAELILMDINMGGIDGIETSSMILTANPDQKIIVCSANIQSGIQDKVNDLGLTFISKPVVADKIKAFVEG